MLSWLRTTVLICGGLYVATPGLSLQAFAANRAAAPAVNEKESSSKPADPAKDTTTEQVAAAEEKAEATEAAKKSTWAHIELKGAYPDTVEQEGLFAELEETLATIIRRIDRVATDNSIDGAVLHISSPTVSWGKVHEIREAIGRVRKADKKVIAWLDSGMTVDYLIATACNEIAMPESGMLIMPGPRAEITFYKNLFDKLDIQAEILRVGEFKSAAEPYTRSEISEPFREEIEALLDDHLARTLKTVAEARGISEDDVKAAIDTALISATTAAELKLIDHVVYEDALEGIARGDHKEVKVEFSKSYAKKKLDTDFSGLNGFVKMMNMLSGNERPKKKSSSPKVAVIYATGMIMPGNSQSDLFGDSVLGSSTIIKAVRQARDDDSVKAIVLRIDSPGGSALASDLMWHELETVEKPFIVSMGEVAASGGYYIAQGADTIFAEPGTITGSIGVVGGKFALDKFMAKLGITHSVIQRGKNGGIISTTTGFTDDERDTFQKMLNATYEQFTKKAAAGRKMDYEKLEKLARGRVYTGTQAKEIGLVDEIGTLEEAITYAKKSAGFTERQKMERLRLPEPQSPFEQLFGTPVEVSSQQRAMAAFMKSLPPTIADSVRGLGISLFLSNEPTLLVAPYRLQIR